MNATEFIKENYTLTNGGEDYRCNHSGQLVGSEDIAEAYHEHKLKLLGIGGVVEQSEQLVCPNCKSKNTETDNSDIPNWCKDCGCEWEN